MRIVPGIDGHREVHRGTAPFGWAVVRARMLMRILLVLVVIGFV